MTRKMLLEFQKCVVSAGRDILSYGLITLIIAGCEATKCFKNEAIGDREENIYFCNNTGTPECCEEDGGFSCCEEQGTKTVREQLILWGSLAAILLVIAVIICYFWKDIHCCKDDTPLREKCCSCCRKKDDKEALTPIPEPADVKSYNMRSRSSSLENFNLTFYRDTPMPTFYNHKPPKY